MKALRLIGLTRKSKGEDEGTHADQARMIEARVASEEGLTLLRVEREHKVSGAKDWRKREIGQAIADVKDGKADGIIVAYQDRITRERMGAAAEIWQALEDAGAVFISCDGTDSRSKGSELLFTIKAAIAREQWKTYQSRSNAGRARAVEVEGVHGGDTPPLGYKFTERKDGSTNVKGAAKHGPLTPVEPAASTVREAFARFGAAEDWAAWSEVLRILGLERISNARAVLTNRVYLGTAYSGEFEKAGAHPALTDEATFNRVAFRLGEQSAEHASRVRPTRTPLALAKVLRCKGCGNVLTPDRTKRNGKEYVSWRCNRALIGVCVGGSGAIADASILPYAIEQAQGWHAASHPSYALGIAADDATRPALEDALRKAERTAKAYAADGGMTVEDLPVNSKHRKAIEDAKANIRAHEAAAGWIARSPEAVAAMIESGDVEALNEFLKQTLRIVIIGVGRHATRAERAPELRSKILYLDHGRTASGENPETFIPLPEGARVKA